MPVTRRRSAWLVAVLVIGAGSWAYATSFPGAFVWDDLDAIVRNPHVRTLWPPTRAMWAPPDTTVSGRPAVSLTLAINYALAPADARDVWSAGSGARRNRFDRNVWGYHAVNLGLHLLAALALFGVVRRSLVTPGLADRYGGSSAMLAAAVALVWVVHPLQTSAVTYVVQRAEALMGLALLATLYCAIRATDASPPKGRWAAGSIAAAIVGMASKEVMVVAPIVVWLWLWIFRGRAAFSRETRGLLIGLVSTWIVLGLLVAADTRPGSVGAGLGGWTAWTYLMTQAAVVVHYLSLSLVPSPLVFAYEWPPVRGLGEVWPQVALLGGLVALTTTAVARRHPAGFLGAWFFLILAPTSSVLPIATEAAVEHRMYLPLAAVVSLVVFGAHAVGRRAVRAGAVESRVAVVAGIVAVIAAAAVFATLTRDRNRDYRSPEALLRDTIAKRPANAHVRMLYGVDLLSSRRYAEAEAQLRAASGMSSPTRRALPALASMYLGSALAAQSKVDEGIAALERATELDATLTEAYVFLAEAHASAGRAVRAAGYFDAALERAPDEPLILARAARLLATSPDEAARNGPRAVALAERAVRLTDGGEVYAFDALGAALAETNRFAEAVTALTRALAIAGATGDAALVADLERHLRLYQGGGKLRAPW